MKLGRKAVKWDWRTLRLSRYLADPQIVPPPVSVDWSKGISQFGMMLNDTLGCCTIAAVGHAVQVWSANASTEQTVTDDVILSYYEKWDGYVPSDPNSDQGGIELDVLKNWQQSDFAGHKIIAFADGNVTNMSEIQQAIWLFGGLYIGLQVPNFVMEDTNPSKVWDVQDTDSGIDGGHAVYVIGYDQETIQFVSWGQVYKMTYAFWKKYVDEGHAVLSADFIETNGLDPNGFNLAKLQADLALIQ